MQSKIPSEFSKSEKLRSKSHKYVDESLRIYCERKFSLIMFYIYVWIVLGTNPELKLNQVFGLIYIFYSKRQKKMYNPPILYIKRKFMPSH